MTTNGPSKAITLVLTALLQPGDRVLVLQPGYHSLTEFAVGLGCTIR
jgi:aspartate/methionine/tyrosine aminotransferase